MYLVVVFNWQVSIILKPKVLPSAPPPSGILAAPQHIGAASVPRHGWSGLAFSPRFGLKVPLERAFSHLELGAPADGSSALFLAMSFLILSRSSPRALSAVASSFL